MDKAIVLLSGGLDSATCLGVALQNHECFPVSFDYAQRHKRELQSSIRVVEHLRAQGKPVHLPKIVSIAGLDFKTSALTSDLAVPKDRDEKTMSVGIPVTYVPARNSIFLAVATAFAEAIEARAVFTGFNAVDYSGYPDCRPEYVLAMEKSLAIGTKRGVEGNPVKIEAPIITLSKTAIVRLAYRLGVPLEHTWSCYVGQDVPCGACDSCKIRSAAFREIGVRDPAL